MSFFFFSSRRRHTRFDCDWSSDVCSSVSLLATFDPWFRAIVHPRPWAGAVFFFVCVFGALDVALPLVGFPPRFALMVSAGAGVIALAPALCVARKWPWRVSATVSALAAFVVAGLAYAGRGWLPP